MIDYFMVDFWIGMCQIITVLLLCICFFSLILLRQHRKPLFILTVILIGLNFAVMVWTAIWPYVL